MKLQIHEDRNEVDFRELPEYKAEDIAKEFCAVQKGEYYAGRPGERMHLFTYYFDAKGLEIGYWNSTFQALTIWKTPRVWADSFKQDDNIKYSRY